MKVRRRLASERKREDYFRSLVGEGVRPPDKLYGVVTKKKIAAVLNEIDRATPDLIDVVFSLLDNQFPNLFNPDLPFCAGASTADIACYVGIFGRRGNKLDREGRDYWIKPLRDVGIIEAVTYNRESGFIEGHLTAKSPSSAYRLDKEFIQLLLGKSNITSKKYFANNKIAQRLMVQSKATEYAISEHGQGDHHRLINLAANLYVPKFLSSYKIIYTDDSDGERISSAEKKALQKLGISLTLSDAFPDIILADKKNNLWFIEAVTSDGEVDEQKIKSLQIFCKRNKKTLAGATTCYLNWKAAGIRQEKLKNIGNNSYLWIASDPSKHFLAKSFI